MPRAQRERGRPFSRKIQRELPAKTPRSAGNQDFLAIQSVHHKDISL
jgi:hypothetical protein